MHSPEIFPLAGDWTLLRPSTGHSLPSRVPGCVHSDLLAAGIIDDMYWRDNEAFQQWIAEESWVWSREFSLPDSFFLPGTSHFLRCEGLDTLATVKINGVPVLEADNMFRTWEIPLTGLARGGNSISVEFASPIPYLTRKNSQFQLPTWNVYDPRYQGRSWLRKMPCSFGWDWGLKAVTCGIWKPISLIAHRAPHISASPQILQSFNADYSLATLSITPEMRASGQPTSPETTADTWRVTLTPSPLAGETDLPAPVSGIFPVTPETSLPLAVTIPNPRLWWPNGMGHQHLYSLNLELLNPAGDVLDSSSSRIGLRSLELRRQPDQWGESFEFVVNSLPIFAKGANWIPADILPSRITRATYSRLLGAAASAHMNMLRVWGGGFYEHDVFYDLCDELGILVWQDFMFSCSTYPAFDTDFLASVSAEARDNILRLRNHPCLALWCGNNEIEQGLAAPEWNSDSMSWDDYATLFEKLLPDLVARHDPATPYWPGSPHSPHGDRTDWNNPACGDSHCWDVWFGGQPFEFQRQWTHRFMSEFGFQSFPELATLESFTNPSDRNLTSYIVDFHQRSPNGNRKLFSYLLDWFRFPKNLEETLWLTQITQAACIQYACEHARRSQPRMMGVLYWQLNDLWPCASWSSIDSAGRWKALHHLARRFFAPVLLSLVEDPASGTMEIHLSNHLPTPFSPEIEWFLSDLSGAILVSGKTSPATLPTQSARLLATVPCVNPLLPDAPEEERYRRDRELMNLTFWARLVNPPPGQLSSPVAAQTFTRPKYIELQNPELSFSKIEPLDDSLLRWSLTVNSIAPALFVRIQSTPPDLASSLSDNFIHVHPALPVTLQVQFESPQTLESIQQGLTLRSLQDSYSQV